jgi:hypothetical protein
MGIPPEALELEGRSLGRDGEPTLAAAYKLLLAQWRNGGRDRELGLHLMFLAWLLLCEPPHLTGLVASEVTSEQLVHMFNEAHDHFETAIRRDAEMLYAVGFMAHLFPYLLGDTDRWTQKSEEYQRLYRALAPGGIDAAQYDGRGAYGDYFGTQTVVKDGY